MKWCAQGGVNTVHVQGGGSVGDEEREREGGGGDARHVEGQTTIGVCQGHQIRAALNKDLKR